MSDLYNIDEDKIVWRVDEINNLEIKEECTIILEK